VIRPWGIIGCALVLAGCPTEDECEPPVAVTEAQSKQSVTALCDGAMERCEFQQDTRLAWTLGRTVFVSPVRCAENIELCLFAVWHEIGHARLGDNERLADCFAADNATDAQIDVAVCYFATTTNIDGSADATHGSGFERATRIRDCQL
jgi:hypothetical protein